MIFMSLGLLGTTAAMNYFFALGIEPYLLNGLVVLVSLLAIQGMSVVNFYLLRFIASPFLRGLLMLFIFMVPVGQMGLAALGLLDQFIDVRSIEGV